MKNIRNFLFLGVFALVVAVPTSHAQTSNMEALLAQLQSLMAQVEQLQSQLREVRGQQMEVRTEIRQELRTDLREGMSDEDVRRVQEILATDREIYPEGLTTGYFGPLTKRALTRFQEKFELEVTGELTEETRLALETLLEERFGEGQVPPGLLRAPGIQKKFELRLREGCNNEGRGNDPFCKRVKIKYEMDDDEMDDDDEKGKDDDDEDDDEDDEDDEDDDDDDDDDDDEDDDEDDDDDDEDEA